MSDPVADQHAITENLNLRLAVQEARKLIAAHCECNDRRQVWRYQKGKSCYAWVPCKECAEFWRLVKEIDA